MQKKGILKEEIDRVIKKDLFFFLLLELRRVLKQSYIMEIYRGMPSQSIQCAKTKIKLSKLVLFQLAGTAQAAFVHCKTRLRLVSRNNCSYCKQEQASVQLCEHELQNLLISPQVFLCLLPRTTESSSPSEFSTHDALIETWLGEGKEMRESCG